MKPEHTKPFNAEHAKAGAPYCQRNRLAARIGIWDSANSNGYILVGTLIQRNGDESSAAWQANGDCSNNTRDSELVMLPLGYCEGKPVFVGETALVYKKNDQPVKLNYMGAHDFSQCAWKRTAPVMPILGSLEKTGIEYMLSTYRTEIEAYWKALDEFNGVKA